MCGFRYWLQNFRQFDNTPRQDQRGRKEDRKVGQIIKTEGKLSSDEKKYTKMTEDK